MDIDLKGIHFAMAPNGTQILLPKELVEAISDFLITRKHSGSVTIQYQGGKITRIESLYQIVGEGEEARSGQDEI